MYSDSICWYALWSKQFYYYVIEDWLKKAIFTLVHRRLIRALVQETTNGFTCLIMTFNARQMSSWFAAWDLAFHVIPPSD